MLTIQVTADQAQRVCGFNETHFLDRKSRRVAPAKLTKTISAFANADGGEIYVGIEDDGSWDGFAKHEDANGLVQAFDAVCPLGNEITYEFLGSNRQSGLVLHVQVKKSAAVRTASDGIAYVRRSAQNLPAKTPSEIETLKRTKGIISHETENTTAPKEVITNSTVTIEFLLGVVPTAEPEPWLTKQALLVTEHPTVAGLLLFAETPQTYLPKGAIKIYRYKSSEAEGAREHLAFTPETIEGCLYAQIRKAVERTAEIIEGIRVVRDGGEATIRYPRETLHEIITNAVLHRDYAINDDVHVRIFDNRVEVDSPGRLPAHITVKNILAERFARNSGVVRLINKFPEPPNQDVGEGLNTAFAAMRNLNLKEPSITEKEASVLVTIRHEQLASADSVIIDYLRTNPTITNARARELTSQKSEIQMRRVLQRLTRTGIIEKTPGTQRGSTTYQLRSKPRG